VDNGIGMSKEDLALSCTRHATSKIYTPEDMEQIMTYGFRGEALASISSVANIEIRTIKKGDEYGWKLVAEPMKTIQIEPFTVDNGTQVFVRNLFYNVPVRRKFLRTNITEFRYISDTMIKFALSKPDIRFLFYDEDTLIFDTKPSGLKKRIADVMGENTARQLIPVDYATESIRISGYLGTPSIAKQSKTGQYMFLNERSIQSKSLYHAIYSAYEHLLEKAKYPFFVLNIDLDARRFDVNVHPQKHEVKFDDERFIYNSMNKAIMNALSANNLVPEIALDTMASVSPFEKIDDPDNPGKILFVNKMTGEIVDYKPNNSQVNNWHLSDSTNKTEKVNEQRTNYSNSLNNYNQNYSANQYRAKENLNFNIDIFAPPKNEFNNLDSMSAFDFIQANSETESQNIKNIESLVKIIENTDNFSYFQIHCKYLCIEVETGMLLIDQHAAHERVLYEKAIAAMNKEFSISQELLFPAVCNLNNSEVLIAKEIKYELEELGYLFDIQGNNAIINAVPLDVAYLGESNSLKEIIEQYDEETKIRHTNKRDNLAASYSCKAAIKTGKKMSKLETIQLVKDLINCKMPYCCPHGRPVIIEFSLYRLDRLFGRIL
jgi:DNA mismatch repair protein MutL